MASKLFLKKINNEIKKYAKEDFKFPNLILRPQENNLIEWYFLIYDLKDTPFENGYYFGQILLNENYPLKAPDFIVKTPNGRFEINKKICTSFSAFHNNEFTTTWNILTMMEGLISFFTEDNKELQKGIGFIDTSIEEKKILASQSKDWNLNNETFKTIFHDFEELIKN